MKVGLDVATASVPFGPGRPSKDEQARRAKVALVVAGARGQGVKPVDLGEVLGLPKQRIHDLAQLGDALRSRLVG